MSRQLIVLEGERWPNGFFIGEESVVWEQGVPLPLMSPNGHNVIGKITEIRREGLHVTGEITFSEEMPPEFDWRYWDLGAYLSGCMLLETKVIKARLRSAMLQPKPGVIADMETGRRVQPITEGRLFEVSIVENPPHPSQTIQVVEK